MGKQYRIGTWKVPNQIQFGEKRDIRKGLVVLQVLAGTISYKEALKSYPRLGLEINGQAVTFGEGGEGCGILR